ncbi:hypothetical protein Tco_0932190 [Tanacetum coccineum]
MGTQCAFCNGLCCLRGLGFINSGLFGFFVLFLTEPLAVIRQLKTLSDTRCVRADSRVALMMYRNGEWASIEGTDLVPGDIVSIGRFVRQKNLSLRTCLFLKVSIKDRRPEEHLSYK